MPRNLSSVVDMEIDEVSLVDVPANPYASVMIQKNYQEADMPDATPQGGLFDAEGIELPEDYDYEPGEVVFDATGQAFQMSAAVAEVEEAANADVLAEVGKSAFFAGRPAASASSTLSKSLAEELRTAISKSAADSATSALISKAADAVEAAVKQADEATTIAKAERNVRLTREFTEVAKSYNVPADPTELGGVLMRMAETMDNADCAVIHKALTSAGAIIFEEIGITGGGTEDGSDPMEAAEQFATAAVSKAAGGSTAVSKAAGVVEFYNQNPEAYEEYLAGKRG